MPAESKCCAHRATRDAIVPVQRQIGAGNGFDRTASRCQMASGWVTPWSRPWIGQLSAPRRKDKGSSGGAPRRPTTRRDISTAISRAFGGMANTYGRPDYRGFTRDNLYLASPKVGYHNAASAIADFAASL